MRLIITIAFLLLPAFAQEKVTPPKPAPKATPITDEQRIKLLDNKATFMENQAWLSDYQRRVTAAQAAQTEVTSQQKDAQEKQAKNEDLRREIMTQFQAMQASCVEGHVFDEKSLTCNTPPAPVTAEKK